MITIRFYVPNPDDMVSRACLFFGKLAGYDMAFTHVSLGFDGGMTDFSLQGMAYATPNDDLCEQQVPDIILGLSDDKVSSLSIYDRAEIFAYTGCKLRYWTLIKKFFDWDLDETDILCTDYVQLLIGDCPEHLSPTELLDRYIGSAIHALVTPTGIKVLTDGEFSTTHLLLEVRQ